MSSRIGVTVLGAVAAALLAVCASQGSEAAGPHDEDLVEITYGELNRIRAEAAKVAPLEERVRALQREREEIQARLQLAQQRLRLAPFSPSALVRAQFQPKLPNALKLEERDGRARSTSLKRALADSERGLVIAYWATWCKPCTTPEELQRLKRLRAELRRQGAELLFMAVDELDKVKADPRANTWLYPLWQYDDGHLRMLPQGYVRSQGIDLPLMIIVPKSGQVSWVRKGALDDDAERDILTAVIRGE